MLTKNELPSQIGGGIVGPQASGTEDMYIESLRSFIASNKSYPANISFKHCCHEFNPSDCLMVLWLLNCYIGMQLDCIGCAP